VRACIQVALIGLTIGIRAVTRHSAEPMVGHSTRHAQSRQKSRNGLGESAV
jgi:hypothetical protein